jgi:hypothetical protein
MAPPLPHAGGARPSLERGGLSSTHRRGEGAAPGKLAAASEPNGHVRDHFAVGLGAGCTRALNRLSPLCFGRA